MSGDVLHTDVAIVGAGLVGLSAAVSLHQAGFSVVLVDSKDPVGNDVDDDVWDSRIYAISPKNAAWLNGLGVWLLLNSARIGEMQAMEIFGDTLAPLTLLASDANADNLGFIVESKALMRALLAKVEFLGIRTLFNNPCEAVITTSRKATLTFANNEILESKLLLAADGSNSWVRQQLNMPMQKKSYDQTAIVANFKVEKLHGNIARQWFAEGTEGKNSILAWLPLPDNTISIVWSVSTKQADVLLKLSDEAFVSQVMAAGHALLGELKLISPALAFPLSLQTSSTLVQGCVVLVGDAAHQVHPMAGQGVNLGFRDVVDMVGLLKEKNQYQALNDSNLLKHYARMRKSDFLNMMLLTDGLYHLFESKHSLVKKVRDLGLSAASHELIKSMLVERAVLL